MPRWLLVLTWLAGLGLIALVLWTVFQHNTFEVLQTRGEIGDQQRDLLVFATILSAVVIVPVYFMLFLFAWRYREGHKHTYAPKWDGNKKLETIWWGIPIAIIIVLAVITWVTSHSLDPYKPIESDKEPLQVQVVSLNWKWLFIYPEYEVASVNELRIPVDRPVEFSITSDAPMNSFWIPQLGGQVYSMTGMVTKLHLIADEPGEYRGMSANISGEGFADMQFMTHATSQEAFDIWVNNLMSAPGLEHLDMATYQKLAEPATSDVRYYHLHAQTLFDDIMMKYMGEDMSDMETMTDHSAMEAM